MQHPWAKDSAQLIGTTSRALLEANSKSGYGHPIYAQSFVEFGCPIAMTACGGWFLKRPIPNSTDYDGMGCYPTFSCADWKQLGTALKMLEGRLASFATVLDPFGDYDLALLKDSFPDLVLPFKSHFVVDLNGDWEGGICAHHRRNIRKSLRHVRIETSEGPDGWLDDWLSVYAKLIIRHQINDLRVFSRHCFSGQLRVPGIVAFRATVDGELAGMQLWYARGRLRIIIWEPAMLAAMNSWGPMRWFGRPSNIFHSADLDGLTLAPALDWPTTVRMA